MKNLDWEFILQRLAQFCTSAMAKDAIMLIAPLESSIIAENSFRDTMDAKSLLEMGIRPHMESLDFFSTWHSRLKKKALLKTMELKDIRFFCIEIVALHEALIKTSNRWSSSLHEHLMNAEEPLSAIEQVITPDGVIRSDASEVLFQLFHEKSRLEREIQNSLDALVKSHQIETYLQDRFVTTRDGRWVIPIKSGKQHFLPGVIHSSSQSKQTVFIEPEKIIPVNNRLRQVEVEIEEEIERILSTLSQYLYQQCESFDKASEYLCLTDQRLAMAQLTELLDSQPIQFTQPHNAQEVTLVDVKHPLLILSHKDVIPNTVTLNESQSILILSGLNAGGKTVLLKSIGLAAHMARCGLPICAAANSKIPFFKEMLISIGDAQNVDAELSTFAAHLKILNSACRLKGYQCLILIDEICGSTDPDEGSALARSFIEQFAKNNTFAVITSHLGPLKILWKKESRIINGSLEYNTKTAKPTYHFIPGVPGDSLAIMTAKRVGVDSDIIDLSLHYLTPESRMRHNFMEEIEKSKNEIFILQNQLRHDAELARETQKKYEKLLAELNKEKNTLLEKERQKAVKKIDEAIAETRATDTFKRHLALQDIKFHLPEIIKASSIQSTESTQSIQSISSSEDFSKKFPPGSKVYIPSLAQDGIIQSTPNSKGEVLVLSQSVRLQMPWQSLKPPTQPRNPTAQLIRQKSSGISISIRDEERTLDLRGKKVDEALDELDRALDQAAQNEENRMKIIHGHGTESLKKSIRAFLSRSVLVKKWKSAPSDAGGDGATWIELDV